MKARHLEAVLRAAHVMLNARNHINDDPIAMSKATAELAAAMDAADPHGIYEPQAPQAPGVDLEETQDVPLRDCPRLSKAIGEHEAGMHD